MGSYTLNRTKPTELALEIVLISIVAQTRNNQRLEGVTADIGVIAGIVCDGKC